MFKHLKAIVFSVVILLPFVGRAQKCDYNYLGTKTLYSKPAGKLTAPPAGYTPVFINHVGRHGARHLTKEVSTSYAYNLLLNADSVKALSHAGKQLLKMVLALDKIEHTQVKSISGEGRAELQGIGQRMFKHYPQVFAGAPKLNVGITKEIRTKQSANAFLTGLKSGFKDSAKVKEYNDDTNLRFYDSSPAYTAFVDNGGKWQDAMNKLQKQLQYDKLKNTIVAKWLSPAFIQTLDDENIEVLVDDIFGFAAIVPSLRAELAKAGVNPAELNFASLFTCDELIALSKIDVADDYLKKAPGTDNNGIQVRIAVPLLVNFINTTDAFIKSAPVNAELRFAHAETIAPFAALLGVDKASKVAADIAKLDAAWKSSDIIPLSANIQWIFYKKKGSGQLLVKVLLNEQEVHINGLATKTFPYYNWADMRKLYMAKLSRLHVGLADNMNEYLRNVK
jgi:hypothetical protein